MNIVGLENLVFGVDDVEAALKCARDYGLRSLESGRQGGIFEALDGTHVTILRSGDAALAPAVAASPNIREQIYGVSDRESLEAIGTELARDRPASLDGAGVLHSNDDDGYPIGFMVTQRRALTRQGLGVNTPGMPRGRPLNCVAADNDARPLPLTLSHVVLYTPDPARSEAFYAQRLGFRTSDRYIDVGPFMRPALNHDHHTLFFLKAPSVGLNHFTFHVAGPSELLKAGWEFARKGYRSAWGPGRHIFGSNYFWYFESPFGGWIEYDADMDQHDDDWTPREAQIGRDTAQIFLFKRADKWFLGEG